MSYESDLAADDLDAVDREAAQRAKDLGITQYDKLNLMP
jgi:hypothetical protein